MEDSTSEERLSFIPSIRTENLFVTVTDDNISTTIASQGQNEQMFDANRLARIYIGTGIVGLVGNVFVIIVMLSSSSLRRKATNMYIIHQSVVDALVSIALMGTARITPLTNYAGASGFLNCLVWQSKLILWILLLCSTYNLVVLTIERYLAIVFPIYHKLHFTRTTALISIAVAWLFCIAFELAGKVPPTYTTDGKCHFLGNWPSTTARRAYGIWVVIVKFFLPLLILVYCYGHIAYILQKKIAGNGVGTKQDREKNSDTRLQRGRRNTIKTLAIVAVAFVLCWSCNQFYFLLYNSGYNLSLKADFYHFGVIMDFVNSCINPFIYVFKFEQFQTAAKRLFYRMFMKHKLNQVTPVEVTATTN